MLQRLLYIDACISNNFIFIFFLSWKIIVKLKGLKTEVAQSVRSFIYFEFALLHLFERGGIAPIYLPDSIRAVWT